MADEKNAFLLYRDWQEMIETLPDEKAGQLMKHIYKYVNDQNPEPSEDPVVRAVFAMIKPVMKRDLKKYESIREKRRESGRKGGLARAENEKQNEKQNEATEASAKQTQANQAVSVSGNVSVSDIKKKNKSILERKEDFKKELVDQQNEKYDRDLLKDFFYYWTEHGAKDIKMRFEKEKTFGLKGRLHSWWKRSQEKSKQQPRL